MSADRKRVGEYDHLNDGSFPVVIEVNGVEIRVNSTDQLAEAVVKSNYGTNRFLSSLVKAIRQSPKFDGQGDTLAQNLEDLANKSQ